MSSGRDIHYRINDEDKIIFVNDDWDQFAQANDGTNIMSSQILNHSLWDFITDRTTQGLYRDLLKTIRNGKVVKFNFRCDSPACRRFLEMEIAAGEHSSVEFYTRTLSIDPRPIPILLDSTVPHSDKFLRICSWCKKIHTGNIWIDLEKAVDHLHLFEGSMMPMLTHGICDTCLSEMKSKWFGK